MKSNICCIKILLQNRFGWDYTGSSNLEELRIILESKIMIRFVIWVSVSARYFMAFPHLQFFVQ